MVDREDIDALLIGALYGELGETDRARLEAHLGTHPQDRLALEGMKTTRGLLRDADIAAAMVEPPAGVSALLLQEAARRAPRSRAAGAGGGLLGYLAGLVRPMIAHPAMAAAATLVIIGGAAGALYLRGAVDVAKPDRPALAHASQHEFGAATAPDAPAFAGSGSASGERANLDEQAVAAQGQAHTGGLDGYRVQLDDGKGGPARSKDQARNELGFAAPAKADTKEGALGDHDKNLKTPAADRGGILEVDGATEPPGVRGFNDDAVAGDVAGEDRLTAPATESLALADGDQRKLSQGLPAAPPPPPSTPSLAPGAGRTPDARAVATTPADGPLRAATTAGKPTTPRPTGTAGGTLQLADPSLVAPYNARSDAATLTWARDQHARMVKLVEAGKCNDVGTLGAALMRRAPDYYQDHVYNDRRIRACRPYIEKSRRAAEPARKVPSPNAADEALAPDKAMD